MANTMVILPVQFQKKMVSAIDSFVSEGRYNSKAEFVREAVRKLISDIETQRALYLLKKNYGAGRGQDVVLTEKIKEEAYQKSMKELGLDL